MVFIIILLIVLVATNTIPISTTDTFTSVKDAFNSTPQVSMNDYNKELAYYNSLNAQQQAEYLLLTPAQKKSKITK